MDIKEYLRQVLFLEKSIYEMKKTVEKYDYKIKHWSMPKEIPYPDLVKEEEVDYGDAFFMAILGSIIIGTVFNIVVGGVIINGIMDGHWYFKSWVITYIVIAIIVFIWQVISDMLTIPSKAERETANSTILEAYNKKVKVYEEMVAKEIARKDRLLAERNDIYSCAQQCRTTLNKLYSLNVIYPKYQNFVAVATFYEYFESKRCDSLEGHEGAYNKYENEIIQNEIISQLSEVIRNLEGIRSNQYMMYQSIKEANNQAEKIYQSSLQMLAIENANAENIALTEYNTRIAAFNTSVLRDIALYDHIVE